ncbi:putative adaptor complex subunit medium chain 3 [Leishmania major strain Friedlin]|uniref:Putative adaptor complex subunit medium chain 3 n=1 Tax=Leishmania major TaxID=5664 RepID=Q4Q2T6_LEIMA|nr:putative adaptor complex subunit medium chain 3 [Leishmania major strain Friedlin]CAG9582136.1 AP-3_complex_subunit_mu_-_putative [Leishmania major strain Friedlin]CAJ07979.1 putative adaptor complex subunit medium chain 3 [Leishmania major strain Friedlin]|eukprot:XP_001686362.1 putative adaptor complex subunit medium chain 3 [Leishmania major strain Friedlin]
MLSCIFLLNEHGEVMVELQFSEQIPRSMLEGFWATYMAPSKGGREAPAAIVAYGGTVFSHIHRNNVFLVGTHPSDDTALVVIEQLCLVARVLTTYLSEVTENTIRENFSTVYQLLQEMFDYGYPLTTELCSLEELVPRPTLENRVRTILDTPLVSKVMPVGSRTAIGVGSRQASSFFGGVPWRDPETRHNTNEILFDVVESLDYVLDSEGRCVRAAVQGSIEVNCRLSGMPDVVLRLRDVDTVVDDVAFHRCVRLDRYEHDRTLCFIPPDGKFTLMKYTCKSSLLMPLPPFYVTPQVTFNATGGRFHCMAGIRGGGAGFSSVAEKDKDVQRLSVRLLLPPNTSSLTVTNCSSGTTVFDRSKATLTWSVGNLTHSATPSLGGEFLLEPEGGDSSGERGHDNAAPSRSARATARAAGVGNATMAAVSFQLPNRIMSSLRVDSVQVLNEIGKPYKGLKYLTQSGSYFIRGA